MIDKILDDLISNKRNLTQEEAYACMEDLINDECPDVVVSAFLVALRIKGETIDEITGLTRSMKDHATQIEYDYPDYLVESCGTGGDTLKTFNVSTVSSIVASSCGATISKHGNRSVSSKFGGADALEALGVNIELNPNQVVNSLDNCNFAFIYAPKYHQATKNIMNIRKKLKTRTIFNLIGPISCPSKVNARMTGVYSPDLVEMMAKVSMNLGIKSGMIVHGFDEMGNPAMDEISNIGKTKVAFIDNGSIHVEYLTPHDFGLDYSKAEDIYAPDSAQEHVQIIHNILNNVTETSHDKARMDLCLMNSASILYVTKRVKSLKEGVLVSKHAIESGLAKKQLENIIKFSNV